MIIEAFVLSVIVGLIRKGSLRNLSHMPMRHTFLFVLPFVMFAAVITLAVRGQRHDVSEFIGYVRIANLVQYVILLTAIGLNLHIRGMWIAGAGTFMNFLVMAANGGVMPVSMQAARIAGIVGAIGSQPVRHAWLSPDSRLAFLSDIIPIPLGSPAFSQVISIGDLVIAVAIFLLIQRYMRGPVNTKEPASLA